tara:strand:- start:1251 stop:1730 length:480 start_codon:yes stop_codon:yes gene_type:complete
MSVKSNSLIKLISENKKAKYNYFIEKDIECGIVLTGSEIKSLRRANCNIKDSYANIENSELWLINCNIMKYEKTHHFVHEEKRKRKLLVKKKELSKLWQNVGREGMTLVPLKMYFNEKGFVKILLGIAKGKKLIDKRETEKKRDWNKQKLRLLNSRKIN